MSEKNNLSSSQLLVTDAARAHMVRVIGDQVGVRLEIRSGKGCGGNEYDFTLITPDKVDPIDLFVELGEGRRLFVKPMDFFAKLSGVTIDFQEDEVGNRRIHVLNPNEKGRCGCGLSVSF